ncbi:MULTISPECIES: hypothetical protein [unclassified Brevundimonas]|uniref:hypothetical protein n=1 Tax=unclassified Brevundimonas TaxID=2622653 RepID=UPI0025BEDE1D|nr:MULTISPECIES: hypothetical protein [unclassified Brevundimonas]
MIITSYDWFNSRSGEHYPDISIAFPGRNHARHVGAEGWHNGITFMLDIDEVGLLRSDARMTVLRDRSGGAVAMTDLGMTGIGSAIAEADSCLERLQREAEERAARERAINHIERDPFGQ